MANTQTTMDKSMTTIDPELGTGGCPNLLQQFDLLLLDLNGTFMFGQDRFGPEQKYFSTYRENGGRILPAFIVNDMVSTLVAELELTANDSQRFDSFPSVFETLKSLNRDRNWLAGKNELSELERIECVVAEHELGTIPDKHAQLILQLSATHTLGLVCNLWSKKDLWQKELQRCGLAQAFRWIVFSSDGTSTKPSKQIFDRILSQWQGPRNKITMIGDSLQRDVLGAHNSGIAAIWVKGEQQPKKCDPSPEFTIDNLLDLSLI